jgi:WD40 repeat protein/serine/threonine protein kinase
VDSATDPVHNRVDEVACEIAERRRRGETPQPEEYTRRYPQFADQIRDLFAAAAGECPTTSIASGVNSLDHESRAGPAEDARVERLGEYRILRMIGRGGMGVVYRAEQESLGRRVALKVLTASTLSNPEHVQRFKREARAAARLHHTNIVPVFGVGEDHGIHFYVMQYIHGHGLDAIIRELARSRARASPTDPVAVGPETEKSDSSAALAYSLATGQFPGTGSEPESTAAIPAATEGGADESMRHAECASTVRESLAGLEDVARNGDTVARRNALGSEITPGKGSTSPPPSEARRPFLQNVARIGVEVAEALHYAHSQGVLHRDIKPSNLLLDNNGTTWITDFGLAKLADGDELTQSGSVVGTLRYMAPERFRGAVDARSDVYSLGLTLYEVITLRPAFGARDHDSLIRQVSQDEPPRLRALAPSVPRDLETIIQKAIAREPELRYQSAGALAEDLRRFLEDRPILSRRLTAAERLVKWGRRNPLVAGLIAAVLVLGTVLTIGSMVVAARSIAAAEASRRRLVRMNVAAGTERVEEGDLLRALPRFGEALRLDQGEPAREEGHRLRLGSVLSATPRIIQLCPHQGIVTSVGFSRDGARIVTACSDGKVGIWDLVSSAPVAPIMNHAEWVDHAEFSPDGARVLTACRDGSARLWDSRTGQLVVPPLAHANQVPFATFSADGRRVVTASWDGSARVWDTATGQAVTPRLPHPYRLAHAAFSPDGSSVVTACDDGNARIWNAATAELRSPLLKHGRVISQVAFAPDGKRVATAGWDGTARVWDATTARQVTPALKHDLVVYGVCFSPDGSRILTASWDGTARIWDATSGRPLLPPLEHDGIVRTAVFSSDGTRILTGCVDGTARVWDAATGKPALAPLLHNGPVSHAWFAADGRRVVTASEDKMARVWETSEVEPVAPPLQLDGSVVHIAISRDGRRLATACTGSDSGRVWDPVSGHPVTPPLPHTKSLAHIEFDRDGRHVVTASWDNTARVWNATTGAPVTPPLEHDAPVHHAVFSPDGELVVTSSEDGTARVWSVVTGKAALAPLKHDSNVRYADFSPDGRWIVTASNDNTAQLWDVHTGGKVGPPLRHRGIVNFAAFSPDGQRIVTSGEDGTARIWNAKTCLRVAPPLDHKGSVVHAAWSADSRRIVTASTVGTAMIWDAATGARLAPPLAQHGSVFHVSFSPDGRFVTTAGFDGTARVWDAATGDLVCLPLRHRGPVWRALFSLKGDWIATASMDRTVQFWRLVDEPRPVADVVLLTQLLSGQRCDAAGALSPLPPDVLEQAWKTLRSKYPNELGPSSLIGRLR